MLERYRFKVEVILEPTSIALNKILNKFEGLVIENVE